VGMIVGSVYQSPDDQLFAMTVEDEVSFSLENQGEEDDYIKRAVKEALLKVGLAGFEKHGIHELSGGQKQRLALASVLVSKPKLLVLDEPVSQMNPQGVKEFMEILTALNKQDKITIIIAEHRVNELAKYIPRLAVMYEGKFIYDGLTEETWNKINSKQLIGLREPQIIKLGRELNLSKLDNNVDIIVNTIKCECSIKKDVKIIDKTIPQTFAPLLSVKDIFYKYPGAKSPTIKNINFSIDKGETIALMGYNGAGKSTLMNLLAGLAEPSAGKITLINSVHAEKLPIGYLRQDPDLMLLADSVKEELWWQNKQADEQYVDLIIDKMSLRKYINDFPLALSKGQRLRTVLGSLLARKPQFLLLDEPTAGQDQQSLDEIKILIKYFTSAGGSVLFCTHDIELAGEIADRVFLMADGELIADDSAEKVLANRTLLKKCGLNEPPMLRISEGLCVPPCINIREVERYVDASVMGRK
ncbi:MAG: ABC transporter ATP-binding protein, partial [Acidaminococcaceae bacterium]